MVLSRRSGALLVLALGALLAGCGESLFDAHGPRDGGPDGGGDGSVPETCPPGTCIADAAANFGQGAPWRYLEDTRMRAWREMTLAADVATGVEPGNEVRRCRDQRSTPACQGLPDALLVTSSRGEADPAIEYTSPTAQVIELGIRAHVPVIGGTAHRVRLYRNSREDVLFTATAAPGQTVAHPITVDALAGDRFLVALEPISAPGPAALHFFVIDAQRAFPSSCQLAASFSEAVGDVVEDLCSTRHFTSMDGGGTAMPTIVSNIGAGPFPGQPASVLRLSPPNFLKAPDDQKLDRTGPVTIQLWVQLADSTTLDVGYAISDLDLDDNGGGSSLGFYGIPPTVRAQLTADGEEGNGVTPTVDDILFPFLFTEWFFVRIVDTPGKITVCFNGAPAMELEPAPDRANSSQTVHLGKNTNFQAIPRFDGFIDDVRVFSGALPCNDGE